MQALHKQVGQRIQELRQRKGISQETLASICNLHRTYIGLIERGERNLSIGTVEVVARGLDVQPSDLFVGIEVSAAPAVRAAQKKINASAGIDAHIATIRQILIDANLTDSRKYATMYKANLKKL